MNSNIMRQMVVAVGVAFAAGLAFVPQAVSHCGGCEASAGQTCSVSNSKNASASIPEVAMAAGQFGTLLAAVEAAGLAETLSGEGPFTVFAPTDDAFGKLPDGTVEALLAEPEKLKSILLHHVVPGTMKAEKVLEETAITAAFGQPIPIVAKESSVMIGGAGILKTDIAASNGIIHVIDTVMLPENMVGVAASTEDFSTLVAAVKAAGLVDTLSGDGPYTLFAPTNEAFAKLPEGTVEDLLKPENLETLQAVLKYHVVPGALKAVDVVELKSAATAHGDELAIDVCEEKGVIINEARVLKTDIMATNGVVHVIDSVMLPTS